MRIHPDTLHDLADAADNLAIAVGDLVYDLELAGLAETEVDLAVTEARNALNRAFLALQRRHAYTQTPA